MPFIWYPGDSNGDAAFHARGSYEKIKDEDDNTTKAERAKSPDRLEKVIKKIFRTKSKETRSKKSTSEKASLSTLVNTLTEAYKTATETNNTHAERSKELADRTRALEDQSKAVMAISRAQTDLIMTYMEQMRMEMEFEMELGIPNAVNNGVKLVNEAQVRRREELLKGRRAADARHLQLKKVIGRTGLSFKEVQELLAVR